MSLSVNLTQTKAARRSMAPMETSFDILYLATVLLCGATLCLSSTYGSVRWLFGIMALVLGVGDAFHLIPRMLALWDRNGRDFTAALGIGKLVTSITMTLFYVLLWHIGTAHYAAPTAQRLTGAIYGLAALRIVLCLLPQNRWACGKPDLKWGVLRNIPFFVQGALVTMLYATGARLQPDGLSWLWLAILLSFVFYTPVVLFSGNKPKIGMLMLPKSCCYVAIVLMGFTLPL